jgi:hypothetical protein
LTIYIKNTYIYKTIIFKTKTKKNMGFESTNRKLKTYMGLSSTLDPNNAKAVTAKFFYINQKDSSGAYKQIKMVENNNYPKPFYGYLTNISVDMDNKVKRDGVEIPLPKVLFEFTDDGGEIYVFELPFLTSTDKRVHTNVFGIINSLAGLVNQDKLGYLKMYITFNSDKNGVKRFNLGLRNVKNWVAGTKNFASFDTDDSKVSWKYQNAEGIPSYVLKKVVDGEEVEIDNRKKQIEFFVKEIETINNYVKTLKYDIGQNTSASMNTQPTDVFEDEASLEDEPEYTTPSTVMAGDDDDDDLPF